MDDSLTCGKWSVRSSWESQSRDSSWHLTVCFVGIGPINQLVIDSSSGHQVAGRFVMV